MERQTRGRDLWGENPGVFFCGFRRSYEVCGWIWPAISEKRPITSHKVLFELNSRNTLSVFTVIEFFHNTLSGCLIYVVLFKEVLSAVRFVEFSIS